LLGRAHPLTLATAEALQGLNDAIVESKVKSKGKSKGKAGSVIEKGKSKGGSVIEKGKSKGKAKGRASKR
jgi:hypothetical protein